MHNSAPQLVTLDSEQRTFEQFRAPMSQRTASLSNSNVADEIWTEENIKMSLNPEKSLATIAYRYLSPSLGPIQQRWHE